MKSSDKPAIAHLVELCARKGVKRVVISPGSRNAPLTISFHRHPEIETIVIPDERVAGFVAMGMSQADGSTTALLCTSGSALLNYAPAVAEAYYLKIPLLVISADRPQEWIDQMEGQTMHQENSLANFTNYEITLPQEAKGGDDLWYSDRCVNEAIDMTQSPSPGPVHINVPLIEPLYGLDDRKAVPKVITKSYASRMALEDSQLEELIDELSGYKKVMVIVGVFPAGAHHKALFQRLSENKHIVILCESTSNLHGERINTCIDRSLESMREEDIDSYIPELVITFGGPLISKKIKRLLRTKKSLTHWHIDRVNAHIDSFKALSRAIQAEPIEVLSALENRMAPLPSSYAISWAQLGADSEQAHREFIDSCPWSDLKTFASLLAHLPGESDLQMASSSPVRYTQLFKSRDDIRYYSNRGVSGIDGCTSTAVGMAFNSERIVTLFTGDMSFYYDSNALWHQYLPKNLKIVVINNAGGGIFRIIPGPSGASELEEFFEAHMENKAEKLATAYGLTYFSAHDESSVKQGMSDLYASDACAILEVFTPRLENADVLNAYFSHLKSS